MVEIQPGARRNSLDGLSSKKPILQPEEEKSTVFPEMIQPFCTEDRVADVECGHGHTLAITQRGRVYSWGEGFKGKLGHGFHEELMLCEPELAPKQITRGLVYKGKKLEPIRSAGCGKSISIILQERGLVMMWGKVEK